MRLRFIALFFSLFLLQLAIPRVASADDDALLALATATSAVQTAADRARSGDPALVQAQYEAARDFEEKLRLARHRASDPCKPLRQALIDFASGHILDAEGVDRIDPRRTAKGRQRALSARNRLTPAFSKCNTTPAGPPIYEIPEIRLSSPSQADVAFSRLVVEGRAPQRAEWATVHVDDGRETCAGGVVVPVTARRIQARLSAKLNQKHSLTITFCEGPIGQGRVVGVTSAPDVWLLPTVARSNSAPRRTSSRLTARLAEIARTFNGFSSVWYQDLRSGETAQWNADARFPAASTVKVALLIAAVERFGTISPVTYELAAIAKWSSNLATNRLLRKLGGSETGGGQVAQEVLRRIGASRSTFTGGYRVGTGVRSRGAEPPQVSSRITTARDLGRILYLIHAGAVDDRRALSLLRLTNGEARFLLSLLLSSDPFTDNVGLFRPTIGNKTPIAQKHGWFSVVRHTAAILYTSTGPKIVVVLTYRDDLSLREAQTYAARVLKTLDP